MFPFPAYFNLFYIYWFSLIVLLIFTIYVINKSNFTVGFFNMYTAIFHKRPFFGSEKVCRRIFLFNNSSNWSTLCIFAVLCAFAYQINSCSQHVNPSWWLKTLKKLQTFSVYFLVLVCHYTYFYTFLPLNSMNFLTFFFHFLTWLCNANISTCFVFLSNFYTCSFYF